MPISKNIRKDLTISAWGNFSRFVFLGFDWYLGNKNCWYFTIEFMFWSVDIFKYTDAEQKKDMKKIKTIRKTK